MVGLCVLEQPAAPAAIICCYGTSLLKENALFGSGILEWLRWLLYFRVPHGQQPRLGLQPSEVRGLSGAGFSAELAHMVIGWDSVF